MKGESDRVRNTEEAREREGEGEKEREKERERKRERVVNPSPPYSCHLLAEDQTCPVLS